MYNITFHEDRPFDCYTFQWIDEPKLTQFYIECDRNLKTFLEHKKAQKIMKKLYKKGDLTLRYDAPINKSPYFMTSNLCVSNSCNLNCAYCFVDHSVKPNEIDIDKNFDFILNNLVYEHTHGISVGVNFTGEPFLNLPLLKQITEKAKQFSEDKGIEIQVNFITNGTLCNDEILEFISQRNGLSISLDGPKEIHDKNRSFLDGSGSYDKIMENLPKFRERVSYLSAGSVLSAHAPFPAKILKHNVDLGFDNVQIKPVRDSYDKPHAFNPDNVDRLLEGYTELSDFLYETLTSGEKKYFNALFNKVDFFGKLLYRVFKEQPTFYRCPAGKKSLEIDDKGDIYPCSSMIGTEMFKMGNIDSGIAQEKIDFWYDLKVTDKPICNECFAQFLCGGGCYYSAWHNNQTLDKPEIVECSITKHISLLALDFAHRLEEEFPEIFDEIVMRVTAES